MRGVLSEEGMSLWRHHIMGTSLCFVQLCYGLSRVRPGIHAAQGLRHPKWSRPVCFGILPSCAHVDQNTS